MYPTKEERSRATIEARNWARSILEDRDNILIVDTETDNLVYKDPETQMVQLTITNMNGAPILNTVVQPTRDLGDTEATAIHGLTEKDWRHAPKFSDLAPIVHGILDGKTVIMYNAAYDTEVLRKEFSRTPLQEPEVNYECAMLAYAKYRAKWNRRQKDWKWPKLPKLATSGNAHDSMTDCLSTIGVIERIAGLESSESTIDLSF